jgi:FtsP/CotA-like multicopper oxidase with cupredoxin domain
MSPQDNVMLAVEPTLDREHPNSNTFVYSLPAFHMGGSFWYHGHHHGSTVSGIMTCNVFIRALPFLNKLETKQK